MQFDHSDSYYGPTLTSAGREAMQKVFGDDMNVWFWSSSVEPTSPYGADDAYALYGIGGYVGNYYRIYSFSGSVRCVSSK